MTFVNHRASVEIDACIEDVFRAYHELPNHPKWSPWLHTVEWESEDKLKSNWCLKKYGVTLRWTAINELVEPNSRIQWKSLNGNITHGGEALFEDISENGLNRTKLIIVVKYQIPKVVAALFSSRLLDKIVTKTVQGDLNRFRDVIPKLQETAMCE